MLMFRTYMLMFRGALAVLEGLRMGSSVLMGSSVRRAPVVVSHSTWSQVTHVYSRSLLPL